MRSGVAAAVAAAALAGCGGDDADDGGYPESAVDAFVAECRKEPDADVRTCRCVVERLQETMPYEEFAAADAALEDERDAPPAALSKLRAAVAHCT